MLRRGGTLMLLLVLLAACGGSSGGGAHQPSSQPSSPADALSRLATAAAENNYSATYDFRDQAKNQTATVKVWRNQPNLRVDVVVGTTTASLIVGSTATYSCSMTPKTRSCLTIAKAGQPLPAPFDVAPTSLFTVDLQQLATAVGDYTVRGAPDAAASGAVPAASCFDVAPRSGNSAATVPQGTYCFSDGGLLTAATYPSGNTVRLVSSDASPPAAGQFTPYASPTPLPG